MNVIQTTVKSFYQQYNYGKDRTKDLMLFCHASVEKYLFSKLYNQLFALYAYKCAQDEKALQAKLPLFQSFKGRALMQQLEFKDRYIVLTEEDEKKGKVGYDNSIKAVNKIEKTNCPAEKLTCIMQMNAEMKTAAIDFSKGKFELVAMDDQMPVYIYIMALAELKCPMAEMNLLVDYLKYQEKSYDTEQLLVTNLQVRSGSDFNRRV